MIYGADPWKQLFPLSAFQAHIPVDFPFCSFVFPCGWSFSTRMIFLLTAWDMVSHQFWDRGFIFLSHFWVCWVFKFFFYLIPQEASCFPSSCCCCTVVAWSSWFPEPWACCRVSQGWDHPSAVAADPVCAGSFWSQRLQQISGVMRREVWWLLKSSFPLLVTVSQLQTILAGSLDRGHVASLSLQSLLSSQTTVWICPNDFYFHSSFSCAFPSLVLPIFFLSLLMRRKITVTFPAHINTLRWKWMRREHGKWVVPTV